MEIRYRSGNQQKSDSNTKRRIRRVQNPRPQRSDQQIIARKASLGVQNWTVGRICAQVCTSFSLAFRKSYKCFDISFHRTGPRYETAGREVVGNRGYKYFGAAKDLPGVRDLFSQDPPILPRKTRAELMKDIDADYYGFRDEDDGVIVAEETKVERQLLAEITGSEVTKELSDSDDNIDDTSDGLDFSGPKRFISHVPYVPTQEEVQKELVRRKKQELLDKYSAEMETTVE